MQEISVQEQTSEPFGQRHKPLAVATADEKAREAWRKRGLLETRMIFFFTLITFFTGIVALFVLYARTSPLSESDSPGATADSYEESTDDGSKAELEWLSSKLNLSEAQLLTAKSLLDDEQRQIDSAITDESQPLDNRTARVNEIQLRTLEALSPMLSSSQNIALQQLITEKKTDLFQTPAVPSEPARN